MINNKRLHQNYLMLKRKVDEPTALTPLPHERWHWWCLTVIVAYPDSKQPYSVTRVFHFQSREHAESKERALKEDFCKEFAHVINYRTDLPDAFTRICENFYADSFMSMPPYESRICYVGTAAAGPG